MLRNILIRSGFTLGTKLNMNQRLTANQPTLVNYECRALLGLFTGMVSLVCARYYRPLTKLWEGNVFTHVCLYTVRVVCAPVCTWAGGVCVSGKCVCVGVGGRGCIWTRGVHLSPRRPTKQAVHILLDYILVSIVIRITHRPILSIIHTITMNAMLNNNGHRLKKRYV